MSTYIIWYNCRGFYYNIYS